MPSCPICNDHILAIHCNIVYRTGRTPKFWFCSNGDNLHYCSYENPLYCETYELINKTVFTRNHPIENFVELDEFISSYILDEPHRDQISAILFINFGI